MLTYPKFITATFFRTPEKHCFESSHFHVGLAVQNNLIHQNESGNPNLNCQFQYPIPITTEYNLTDWKIR